MFDPATKILIVDDMMTMRMLVSKICKTIGYNDITEAADGSQAWEILNSGKVPIGLVISDWNMPNSTGLDLLKRVRADSRYKKLPFLMVTAESEQPQVIEAMKSGVDGYVVKPFDKETLKAKMEAIYKKYAK